MIWTEVLDESKMIWIDPDDSRLHLVSIGLKVHFSWRSGPSLTFRSFEWALAQSIREVKPEMVKKMIREHHRKSFNFAESPKDQVETRSGPPTQMVQRWIQDKSETKSGLSESK